MATLNKDDEVIIPAPYWVSYPDIVLLAGAHPIVIECSEDQGFKLTAKDLESVITNNTKWLILNSPSNPTGACYSEQEIKNLAMVLKRNPHVNILSDDIYEHVVYEDFKFFTMAQIPELKNKVVTMNGVSKSYAMTGWRIGYILSANREAMAQMIKIQYYITACSNDAMQYAVLEAMNEAADYPDVIAKEFKERCDLIVERLNSMPGVQCHKPKGAIYVFPKIQVKGFNSEELALEILKDGVLCSPGSAIGPSGELHLRFAYTISKDEISKGMDKLQYTLDRLNRK